MRCLINNFKIKLIKSIRISNMGTSSNFFTDKDAIKTIDIFRIIYFIVAIIAFLVTETGRYIYRPFIYQNGINDFGIADSIGNLGGIIVQIFLMLSILNSHPKKYLIQLDLLQSVM